MNKQIEFSGLLKDIFYLTGETSNQINSSSFSCFIEMIF
jgi:hypothetical protein